MLTVEQIIEHLQYVIAQDRLSGNVVGLKQTQTAAGVLMAAAERAGDKDGARRFREIAAQAANKRADALGDD